jgi:uncharacterized protein YndB with AHSA1/START domain
MNKIAIKKQLTVEAPIERAFRVFTQQMSVWWPKSHHIGKSPLVQCVVEPQVGGRWYEVCEDGSQCDWGKVLAWEPPHRLVLAWQLDASFAFDRELITEVEVQFSELAPQQTRVDFEHRDLEKLGEAVVSGAQGMDNGWGMILEQFVRTAAG